MAAHDMIPTWLHANGLSTSIHKQIIVYNCLYAIDDL